MNNTIIFSRKTTIITYVLTYTQVYDVIYTSIGAYSVLNSAGLT